jgi:hypothetical protein
MSYFEFHQLSRGLSISENGIERTSKNIITLNEPPVLTLKIENTNIQTSYSFSEASKNLHLLTSMSTSLSLQHRFVNAEAEYNIEKQKQSSSSAITEYLLSKYMIHQARVTIGLNSFKLNMDFYRVVEDVVMSDDNDLRKTANLIKLLNEWGIICL